MPLRKWLAESSNIIDCVSWHYAKFLPAPPPPFPPPPFVSHQVFSKLSSLLANLVASLLKVANFSDEIYCSSLRPRRRREIFFITHRRRRIIISNFNDFVSPRFLVSPSIPFLPGAPFNSPFSLQRLFDVRLSRFQATKWANEQGEVAPYASWIRGWGKCLPLRKDVLG